jgi:hypothetical protein
MGDTSQGMSGLNFSMELIGHVNDVMEIFFFRPLIFLAI